MTSSQHLTRCSSACRTWTHTASSLVRATSGSGMLPKAASRSLSQTAARCRLVSTMRGAPACLAPTASRGRSLRARQNAASSDYSPEAHATFICWATVSCLHKGFVSRLIVLQCCEYKALGQPWRGHVYNSRRGWLRSSHLQQADQEAAGKGPLCSICIGLGTGPDWNLVIQRREMEDTPT